MVSFGCVAKLLSGFECRCANIWVKTVNPGWYEARQIPRTMLTEKVCQTEQATNKPADLAKKVSTPLRQPYF